MEAGSDASTNRAVCTFCAPDNSCCCAKVNGDYTPRSRTFAPYALCACLVCLVETKMKTKNKDALEATKRWWWRPRLLLLLPRRDDDSKSGKTGAKIATRIRRRTFVAFLFFFRLPRHSLGGAFAHPLPTPSYTPGPNKSEVLQLLDCRRPIDAVAVATSTRSTLEDKVKKEGAANQQKKNDSQT